MFSLFKKPEHHLEDAVKGITKYVNKFKLAAEKAKEEINIIENNVAALVDKYDKAVEEAYTDYMKVEVTCGDLTDKAIAEADARKELLNKVAAQAQKAVENHEAIYLN